MSLMIKTVEHKYMQPDTVEVNIIEDIETDEPDRPTIDRNISDFIRVHKIETSILEEPIITRKQSSSKSFGVKRPINSRYSKVV